MLLGLSACQKESLSDEDLVLMTEQEILVEILAADLDALVMEAAGTRLPGLKAASSRDPLFLGGCPAVQFDPDATPKTLVLDFGDECTGADGKVRSGRIVVFAPSFSSDGMTWSVSLDNFLVDGKKIGGIITREITFNPASLRVKAETLEDLTVTFTGTGETVFRKATLIREYGLDLWGWLNNQSFTFTGKVDFTNSAGVSLSKTIDVKEPVTFSIACHQPVSGVVAFGSEGGHSWTVDFGDGSCDDEATLIHDGVSKTIQLK